MIATTGRERKGPSSYLPWHAMYSYEHMDMSIRKYMETRELSHVLTVLPHIYKLLVFMNVRTVLYNLFRHTDIK